MIGVIFEAQIHLCIKYRPPWLHFNGPTLTQLSLILGNLFTNASFEFTINNLAESCHNLIVETEANAPAPGAEYDTSFLASFWLYPQAEALVYVTDYM